MAEYNKKWADLFPATIGNQNRPSAGVDNTLPYETDKFPQHIANDPVRYDKMNAVVSQSMSNDERLNEKIKRTSDDLAAHNKDPKAHATGIAGNAATASKLASPRTISLTGKASGSASFDGSANAAINVTSVNADTASKLSTARKINITGNATGAANFDGSGDANISVSVSQAAHADNADNATADKNGADITATYLKKAGDTATGAIVAPSFQTGTAEANYFQCKKFRGEGDADSYYHAIDFGYKNHDMVDFYEYGGTWNFWQNNGETKGGKLVGSIKPNGWNGNVVGDVTGNATTATKLQTPRTISLTGNASGSANFDGSGNVSINVNVNESKHAVNADTATSATTAGNVSGKIYYSSDSPSVATDKLFVVKQAHVGDDNVPNNGLVIQSGPNGQGFNGKLYITDNGSNGVWIGGVDAGRKIGWTRLVENKGSWNINAATATKLQTPRTISLTGNASGSANFDGSGNISINTTVNYAGQAAKLANESGTNYLYINTTDDSWNVLGSNPGMWLKSIRTEASAPPYSIGNFSAAVAFGGSDTKGIITHAYNEPLVKFAGGAGSTAQWKFTIKGGSNNETYDLNNFPTKTGSGASGTWPISISGNADTVDGYHASDMFRYLGGNQTPVITDIFDRAGTIDMTTMSDADKATHKANINKAANASQNLWNTDTGMRAYGGDYDISGGYNRGTLKLTQSYKNFDKIMVQAVKDKCNYTLYRVWDVWALVHALSNNFSVFLVDSDYDFWEIYGNAKRGNADAKWSTDTVWSCNEQNCGIVAIYGIKY